jgi:hypothetical protein
MLLYNIDFDQVQVYCDLDGVLVDFEGGFLRNFGFAHDTVSESEMWRYITSHKRHWHDLPMMHDAEELWDFIKPLKPTILTGCPRSGYEAADQGKREWCANMLGADVPVITCLSKNKPQHMSSKPLNILIDDLEKNKKRWVEAGGVPVLHTSAAESIKELSNLLASYRVNVLHTSEIDQELLSQLENAKWGEASE